MSGFAAILVLSSFVALSAPAQPTLQVIPLARDGQVYVSFRLGEAFTEQVKAAVHSGMTISFVYKVDLMRSSALWVDRTLGSAVVTATVKYDNLTRRYSVTRKLDGRTERAEQMDREEAVQEWLTTDFDKLLLFRDVQLERNSEYIVRVRAHTTPRNAGFIWPWQGHDVMGLAKFTVVR